MTHCPDHYKAPATFSFSYRLRVRALLPIIIILRPQVRQGKRSTADRIQPWAVLRPWITPDHHLLPSTLKKAKPNPIQLRVMMLFRCAWLGLDGLRLWRQVWRPLWPEMTGPLPIVAGNELALG
jgi:hypothetical protein